MTFHETTIPHPPVGNPLHGIGSAFGRGIRAMQYARMLRALSELSDERLRMIGLRHGDIPRHAHDCIYGQLS